MLENKLSLSLSPSCRFLPPFFILSPSNLSFGSLLFLSNFLSLHIYLIFNLLSYFNSVVSVSHTFFSLCPSLLSLFPSLSKCPDFLVLSLSLSSALLPSLVFCLSFILFLCCQSQILFLSLNFFCGIAVDCPVFSVRNPHGKVRQGPPSIRDLRYAINELLEMIHLSRSSSSPSLDL